MGGADRALLCAGGRRDSGQPSTSRTRFRSCLGIIRLGKGAGQARLEAACRRALHFKTCSYLSIKSILEKHLEQLPLEQELPLASPAHENVRGGLYYTQSSSTH